MNFLGYPWSELLTIYITFYMWLSQGLDFIIPISQFQIHLKLKQRKCLSFPKNILSIEK